ncbi:MAG: hypothetical protein FJ255_00610 [Phycisphaerae bacterium]|nr:hypothetical protein [Phycisphaerae bacterium]
MNARPIALASILALTGLTGPVATFPAAAAARAADAAKPVDLRPKWTVGQDVRYKIVADGTNEMDVPGMGAQKTTDRQEIVVRLTPKEVGEGGAKVELTYESIKINVEGSPRGPQTFDSTKPDEPGPLAQALRPILGLTLTLHMDRNGNITEVTGGDDVQVNPRSQWAGRLVQKGGVSSMFGRVITGNRTTGEANVGDTWQTADKIDLSAMGSVKLTAENTLKGLSGDVATIGIKGTLELDASRAQAMQVNLTSGAYEGSAQWDTAAGQLNSMEVKQSMAVEAEGPMGKVSSRRSLTEVVSRVTGAAPAGQ